MSAADALAIPQQSINARVIAQLQPLGLRFRQQSKNQARIVGSGIVVAHRTDQPTVFQIRRALQRLLRRH